MSARLRGVALLVAALGLVAACGSAPEAEQPTQQVAENADKSVAPEQVGSEAPADPVVVPASLKFTGKTLDGKPFDASTLAGKPALLWFWAPWCATCASEASSVADLAEKYQGKLGILGIAGMGNNKEMHEFVSDLEVGAVPHLDDQAGKIWKKFKITQQSTYVVVDRTGKVVTTGYLDDLQLTAEVKSLVA